jgi:hypothetical protein
MRHTPHILLINPWITDFAAYNFWIKPLGLLHIASLLSMFQTAFTSGESMRNWLAFSIKRVLRPFGWVLRRLTRRHRSRPILVEYSPIPHTPLFERARQTSQFDLGNEPLYHNNSILPCQWEGFTMADYRRLKEGISRR